MRLVNRVFEARKAAQVSQAALAQSAGVAIATIAKIEANDGYTPSSKTMMKLAGALGQDVSDLFWTESLVEQVPA